MRTVEEIKKTYINEPETPNWSAVWCSVYLNLVDSYREMLRNGSLSEEKMNAVKDECQLQLDELFFKFGSLDGLKSELSQESIYLDEIFSILKSGRIIPAKDLKKLIFKGITKSEVLCDYLQKELFDKMGVYAKKHGNIKRTTFDNLKKELFQKLDSVFNEEGVKDSIKEQVKDHLTRVCDDIEKEFH